MHFKGVKEFSKDFLFSLLSTDNIRVLLGIVDVLDIINVQDSTLVLVHHLKGFLTEISSKIIHLSSHSPQEFIVADAT
jgi:hypothetical protein